MHRSTFFPAPTPIPHPPHCPSRSLHSPRLPWPYATSTRHISLSINSITPTIPSIYGTQGRTEGCSGKTRQEDKVHWRRRCQEEIVSVQQVHAIRDGSPQGAGARHAA